MEVEELATASGCHRVTIYRMENTKDDPGYHPDLESFEQVAAAFDMPLSQFFALVERLSNEPAGDTVPPRIPQQRLLEGEQSDGGDRPIRPSAEDAALLGGFRSIGTAIDSAADRIVAVLEQIAVAGRRRSGSSASRRRHR